MSPSIPPEPTPEPPKSDHEVLVEIRDLLRELLKRYPAVSYTRPQGLTG